MFVVWPVLKYFPWHSVPNKLLIINFTSAFSRFYIWIINNNKIKWINKSTENGKKNVKKKCKADGIMLLD